MCRTGTTITRYPLASVKVESPRSSTFCTVQMGSPANARHVLVPLLPSALTVVESHTLDAGRVFGIWSPLSPAYPPPKQNCAVENCDS